MTIELNERQALLLIRVIREITEEYYYTHGIKRTPYIKSTHIVYEDDYNDLLGLRQGIIDKEYNQRYKRVTK